VQNSEVGVYAKVQGKTWADKDSLVKGDDNRLAVFQRNNSFDHYEEYQWIEDEVIRKENGGQVKSKVGRWKSHEYTRPALNKILGGRNLISLSY
jgi:hypothetical protein